MIKKVAVLISTRERPSELALLLQSLRTQTFQDFDIFIIDDASSSPLTNYHFMICMITRLKSEGHNVFVKRHDFAYGVSKARQAIVDWALDTYGYPYLMRVDDDVVLEPDFIERLFKVIDEGYDLASGVTAPMSAPQLERDPKYLKGIVNRIILDEEGNYVYNGDDCGMDYTESIILPAHHFRSSALYKSEIHKKANYVPTKLSKHGFREEQIFSYKILLAGFKIGVDTKAMAWHQLTMSGGERDTTHLAPFNQEILNEWTKEHKDELKKLFPNEPMPTKQELQKETNSSR